MQSEEFEQQLTSQVTHFVEHLMDGIPPSNHIAEPPELILCCYLRRQRSMLSSHTNKLLPGN
jgi:hypothetical protein